MFQREQFHRQIRDEVVRRRLMGEHVDDICKLFHISAQTVIKLTKSYGQDMQSGRLAAGNTAQVPPEMTPEEFVEAFLSKLETLKKENAQVRADMELLERKFDKKDGELTELRAELAKARAKVPSGEKPSLIERTRRILGERDEPRWNSL